MFGLIVFGAISMGRLGVSQMPDVDFPVLEVRTTWEGAAPEVLEAELVDKIEEEVIGVEGLREIRSTIRMGTATTELEFDLNRDIDAALQEVQAAISTVNLPLNVEPPIIRKNSTENEPIMWIGVSGERAMRDLIEYVDLFLRDQFQVIPGVGEVTIGGFTERNLRVWVDTEKLRKYELTVLDLVRAIELEHSEIAAGYIENKENELNVRMMGEGLTPQQVSNILIKERGGQPIYDTTIRISDVAKVEDGLADIRRIARVNGKDGVSMGIRKQRGSNEVQVGKAVKEKIKELEPILPKDISMQVIVDFTRFAEQAIQKTEHELVLAGILTAIICYLFLGSWSPSLNVILSIPTSVLGTMIVLYFMGFTLNTFTLLGLALAIGIIVDDAIMVLENIVRHFQMGKHRRQASLEGAREITFAAMAATIAVVAIFLPVAFMSGIIGRFFYQFGVTISAAVLLSLLEAITLTPMRCSQFLKREEKENFIARYMNRLFRMLSQAYYATLRLALGWRWTVIVVSSALFFLSLLAIKLLRSEFVPTQDQNFVRMAVEVPVGSSLAYTDSKVREVEAFLKKQPEMSRYFAVVGGLSGVANQGFIPVSFIDKSEREKSVAELTMEYRKQLSSIKDIRVRFQDLSSRGLTARRSQPVEFNLRGPNYEKLDEFSKEIMARLEKTGLVVDLDSSYRTGMPELRIWPDRQAAAVRGVSVDNIGRTINAAIGGIRQGKFTKEGRRYDVRIRLNPEERLTPEDLKRLEIRTSYGELVPLESVVKWEIVPTVQTISRVNRQRALSVTANLAPGASQAEALQKAESISREVLPAGYSFHLEGGAQTFQESFAGLWFTFILGIVVAYMVLASQFNSFIHPFIVLLAMPFSITGGGLLLLLTGQSLNLFSAIGFILLMGIVKKNSILLVEFTNQIRERDALPVYEALLKACPIRLRPILMTSLATMSAAIPSALATGPGSETRVPMAMTVIGGVAVSTFFTLFVVPCAYSLMARLERHEPQEVVAKEEASSVFPSASPTT